MTLAEFNSLPAEEAWRVLQRCCGAENWVDYVCGHRPYRDRKAFDRAVSNAFDDMDEDDWRETFSSHPRIGDVEALREKFAETAAGEEQSGVKGAADDVLKALARGNKEYEKRFGFIFIVFATGKSAGEMLEILQSRLGNDPEHELRTAAEEQRKITALRLDKMLGA